MYDHVSHIPSVPGCGSSDHNPLSSDIAAFSPQSGEMQWPPYGLSSGQPPAPGGRKASVAGILATTVR